MTSKSEWKTLDLQIDPNSDERLFFSEHEWDTIEAASARIIPTDHDPGAKEARVVVFIDRYLSGIDYVYASADGSGFLQLAGAEADAARARNAVMKQLYREGIAQMDEIARRHGAPDFVGAD